MKQVVTGHVMGMHASLILQNNKTSKTLGWFLAKLHESFEVLIVGGRSWIFYLKCVYFVANDSWKFLELSVSVLIKFIIAMQSFQNVLLK